MVARGQGRLTESSGSLNDVLLLVINTDEASEDSATIYWSGSF